MEEKMADGDLVISIRKLDGLGYAFNAIEEEEITGDYGSGHGVSSIAECIDRGLNLMDKDARGRIVHVTLNMGLGIDRLVQVTLGVERQPGVAERAALALVKKARAA
jgi:hypothetical protein